MYYRTQLNSFRCLIVERQGLCAHFIRRTLSDLGISSVKIVSTLQAALRLLERSPIELIIADWSIKDKSTGFGLIDSLSPKQRNSYSIIYTCSEHNRAMLSAAMAEGPEELILQPYSMSVFRTRIIRACENHLETISVRKALVDRDYDTAFELCQELMLRHDLVGYWASRKLTEIFQAQHKFESVEQISRTLLQKRNAEWMRIALINALHEQGHHDEALKEAKDYVEVCGFSAQPYQLLGRSHYVLGEKDKALMAYEQARKLNPDCFDTLTSCANISVELGLLDKAVLVYRRALQMSANGRNETPSLYIKLANVIRKKTENVNYINAKGFRHPLEDAYDILNMGIKRFPQDEILHVYRSIVEAQIDSFKGKKDSAVHILSSSLGHYEAALYGNMDAASDFLLALNTVGSIEESRDLLYRLEYNGPRSELNEAREQMMRHEVGTNERYSLAVEHNRSGVTLMRKELSMQAIIKFRQAIDIYPQSTSINMNLVEAGIVYMSRFAKQPSLIAECKQALERVRMLKSSEQEETRYNKLKEQLNLIVIEVQTTNEGVTVSNVVNLH